MNKLSVTIPIGSVQMCRQGCMGYSIPINIAGQVKHFLIDTGAQKSIISPRTIREIDVSTEKCSVVVRGANDEKKSISECVYCDIHVGSLEIGCIDFLVHPISPIVFGVSCAGILGADILYRLNFIMQMKDKTIRIFERGSLITKHPLLNVTLNRKIETTALLDTAASYSWLSDYSILSSCSSYYSLVLSFGRMKIVKKENYGELEVGSSYFSHTVKNIGKGPTIIRDNKLVGIVLGKDILKSKIISFNNGSLRVEESEVVNIP